MMSPASSGGVRSRVSLTASMMWPTVSSSAWRISSESIVIVFGSPETRVAAADLDLDQLGKLRGRAGLDLDLLRRLRADREFVAGV